MFLERSESKSMQNRFLIELCKGISMQLQKLQMHSVLLVSIDRMTKPVIRTTSSPIIYYLTHY
ncbi:MAG: hypothetical protein ACM3VS_04370 [Candidatus Dadabacteria bacterium]